MWKLSAVATLLCALSTFSPSAAYRPGDEICTLSDSNQCAADSITPSSTDGSVLIYPGGKTRCAFDDFKDPNGSFTANKTYFFQVFPKKTQKKKVMLFFQGGGACTGNETCSFSLQCSLGKSSTFSTVARASSAGILDRMAPDNLFKDWNIIYIPYCTGDLHVGNAVRETTEGIFEAVLDQKQCRGKNVSTHMVGYENTQAALKWAAANYPNPEHLIVGGSSAGSLAAQAVSALVADMWKVKGSSIRYSVLGDSYVGVLPEETKPSGAVLDYFGACDVDLKVPDAIVSSCKNHSLTVTQLMSSLLKEESFSDWVFIDSKADKTQRYFYQLMKDGILGYPFNNLIGADAFFKEMTTMIDAYKTVSSSISTFFVEGEKHVFLNDANYTAVLSDTGAKLGDFLTTWLASKNSSSSDESKATPAATSAASPSTVLSGVAALVAAVLAVMTFELSQQSGASRVDRARRKCTVAAQSARTTEESSFWNSLPRSQPKTNFRNAIVMWKTSVVATLLCALSAFSPSAAIRSGDETCTLSSANQCAADSITPSALDGSVLIYPGGKTRCAFDDFKDPKGVFNTNSTFFFQVFPKQQKKKVMLFFQGGGACSDSDTCGFSLQCSLGKSSTFTPNATPGSTGILNHTASDNLFKDWNIIHIPYCTGDLHIGNAVVTPADAVFASLLGQSQCLGKNLSTHMVGYENTQAALKWALSNYPNPEHLIVGGSSAGSLAAQAVSALIADMWKVEGSSIRYSMLGDSYVGVLPEETKPASTVLDYFGTCDVDLKAPAGIVAACKNHTLTVTQLFSGLIKEVAYSDWLFIDSKADKTQRYFYQLVKDGILGYPFANLMSGADFFTQVTTMINAYKSISSRISTFFVEGEKHVFLSDASYTSVLSDAGDKLGAFLTKWLLPHNDPSVAPTPAPVPAVSPASTPAPVPAPVPSATPVSAATPTPAAMPGVTPQTTPSPVQVPGTTPAPAAGSSPSPAVTTTPSVRPGC